MYLTRIYSHLGSAHQNQGLGLGSAQTHGMASGAEAGQRASSALIFRPS